MIYAYLWLPLLIFFVMFVITQNPVIAFLTIFLYYYWQIYNPNSTVNKLKKLNSPSNFTNNSSNSTPNQQTNLQNRKLKDLSKIPLQKWLLVLIPLILFIFLAVFFGITISSDSLYNTLLSFVCVIFYYTFIGIVYLVSQIINKIYKWQNSQNSQKNLQKSKVPKSAQNSQNQGLIQPNSDQIPKVSTQIPNVNSQNSEQTKEESQALQTQLKAENQKEIQTKLETGNRKTEQQIDKKMEIQKNKVSENLDSTKTIRQNIITKSHKIKINLYSKWHFWATFVFNFLINIAISSVFPVYVLFGLILQGDSPVEIIRIYLNFLILLSFLALIFFGIKNRINSILLATILVISLFWSVGNAVFINTFFNIANFSTCKDFRIIKQRDTLYEIPNQKQISTKSIGEIWQRDGQFNLTISRYNVRDFSEINIGQVTKLEKIKSCIIPTFEGKNVVIIEEKERSISPSNSSPNFPPNNFPTPPGLTNPGQNSNLVFPNSTPSQFDPQLPQDPQIPKVPQNSQNQ